MKSDKKENSIKTNLILNYFSYIKKYRKVKLILYFNKKNNNNNNFM